MFGRYILFSETVVGDDGHKYWGGVKWSIKDEDYEAIYLVGEKNIINKFITSQIKKDNKNIDVVKVGDKLITYETGNVVKDKWRD